MSNLNYNDKFDQYFKSQRTILLDLIPEENRNGNILELGAGDGSTLLYAKNNGFAKKIYGIEICKSEDPDSNQLSSDFEEFIIGNVENMELKFKEDYFDVIICADVLEHLVDPYTIVKKLSKHLKKDGVLIASTPNVRDIHTLYKIALKGDFQYTDRGILDETHLRFFCKKNIESMFTDNGYHLINTISNLSMKRSKRSIINSFTLKIFEEFLTVQYYTVAKKT